MIQRKLCTSMFRRCCASSTTTYCCSSTLIIPGRTIQQQQHVTNKEVIRRRNMTSCLSPVMTMMMNEGKSTFHGTSREEPRTEQSNYKIKMMLCSSTSKRHASSSSSVSQQQQPPGTVMVSIEEALTTTTKALEQIGWDDADAKLQAEIMVAAELCGNNQGLVKMYQPAMMQPASNCSKPSIERDSLNSAVINAHQSPGMLAAVTAADVAIAKMQQNTDLAIAIVSSYNSSTSSGQLAYYVERIAKHGLVGIAMCNSPEFVAPAKGAKSVFGTNPMAVGIPQANSPYPFTFDMATSAIALFGVLTAKSKNEPLPEHVAYDFTGSWTTDASKVMDGGAIATFGGHKGMGLSLCVELLAGALSGSAVLGQVPSKKEAKSWGHTFIVIRPELLVDDYPNKVASIIHTVKQSGPTVRIPGERSAITSVERKKAGKMPIPEKIWESIVYTSKHGLQTK